MWTNNGVQTTRSISQREGTLIANGFVAWLNDTKIGVSVRKEDNGPSTTRSDMPVRISTEHPALQTCGTHATFTQTSFTRGLHKGTGCTGMLSTLKLTRPSEISTEFSINRHNQPLRCLSLRSHHRPGKETPWTVSASLQTGCCGRRGSASSALKLLSPSPPTTSFQECF